MTKRCETCMAREADPSDYHDDACPVFQEQAAYQVGHEAGIRDGIAMCVQLLLDFPTGTRLGIIDAMRALAEPAPAAPKEEAK